MLYTVTIGDDHPVQLKKLNDKSIDQLFEAILTLGSVEECYVFFDDLCTVNEIQSLSRGWKWRACWARDAHTTRLKQKREPAPQRFHA